MIAIGRGLLLALICVLGLALGLGGFLTLGLTKVAPPTIAPAASPQDWEITLELSDAFLAERINNGGENGAKNGGAELPIKLSGATAESRDDGTITIKGVVAPSLGAQLVRQRPAGRGRHYPFPYRSTLRQAAAAPPSPPKSCYGPS